MKLFAENEKGERIEIHKIHGLGKGDTLILKSKIIVPKARIEEMEKQLSDKLQKKVVVLGPDVEVVGTT